MFLLERSTGISVIFSVDNSTNVLFQLCYDGGTEVIAEFP